MTDEHLPVIDGVGVLEGVKGSSNGRVLHVEGEIGVAFLDDLRRVGGGTLPGGRVNGQV